LAGGFIGINYETNDFLGLGETLSVAANVGNRERLVQFGFTEPYLLDRPIQFGFTIFTSKYDFNQARQAALNIGQSNLNLPTTVLNTLQNYSQSSTGFTSSLGYTLRRSLKRLGFTCSLNRSSIRTFNDSTLQLFQALEFRNLSGPDRKSTRLNSSHLVTSYA